MPKRAGLKTIKRSKHPQSRADHDRRGAGTSASQYRTHHRSRSRAATSPVSEEDVDQNAELLLSLARDDSDAGASSPASALTAEDQQLLDAAVQRILRPADQGGIKRTRSGEKAVHDIRDMLTRLSNQVVQSKAEHKEAIEGLQADVADALEKWEAADALLTAVRKEKAELQRQLTREQARPKLPQTRKENVQRSVCW
jgi:hypothetical protein